MYQARRKYLDDGSEHIIGGSQTETYEKMIERATYWLARDEENGGATVIRDGDSWLVSVPDTQAAYWPGGARSYIVWIEKV